MKKIINQIPDRYYLISMYVILFIMVLGRYMFSGLMYKWGMLLYFRACEKKSVNSVFYDYIFTYPAL